MRVKAKICGYKFEFTAYDIIEKYNSSGGE